MEIKHFLEIRRPWITLLRTLIIEGKAEFELEVSENEVFSPIPVHGTTG